MKITKQDLLFVYDVLLHRRLERAGCECLAKAISMKDRPFWLYQRTDQSKQIMEVYAKSKNYSR